MGPCQPGCGCAGAVELCPSRTSPRHYVLARLVRDQSKAHIKTVPKAKDPTRMDQGHWPPRWGSGMLNATLNAAIGNTR
jgi:hypothetical protein